MFYYEAINRRLFQICFQQNLHQNIVIGALGLIEKSTLQQFPWEEKPETMGLLIKFAT